MKKILLGLLIISILFTGIIAVLNIRVTTKQGVNFQVHSISIPLYLKILDFIDRYYNYKQLVKRIVEGTNTDWERVMKIFEWTHQNVRRVPEGFPIIDDHVWYIIIRGYGISDQSCDVFTTLCNYAGTDAFFRWIYNRDRTGRIPLSFVRIEEKWGIFDPYYGTYFRNKYGKIADVEEIKSGDIWIVENLDKKPDIDYTAYLDNLPSVKDIGLTRANIQSPFRRIMFELRKWIETE